MDAGGTLGLRTGLAPDGRAYLEVTDTGRGIDPDERDRIFDPYYTTKARGTGLGLPIAHKIVAAHGGEIRLTPRPQGGTSAMVLLPVTGGEGADTEEADAG
jgi:two-component system sensor histidine kinase HydH